MERSLDSLPRNGGVAQSLYRRGPPRTSDGDLWDFAGNRLRDLQYRRRWRATGSRRVNGRVRCTIASLSSRQCVSYGFMLCAGSSLGMETPRSRCSVERGSGVVPACKFRDRKGDPPDNWGFRIALTHSAMTITDVESRTLIRKPHLAAAALVRQRIHGIGLYELFMLFLRLSHTFVRSINAADLIRLWRKH